MKWLMLLIVLSYGTVQAAQTSQPPYVYYYSSALNAIVVERADGSDSRTLGEGLTSPDSTYVGGPGWSPDGQWFAWYGTTLTDSSFDDTGKSHVIRVDNQSRLKSLDYFVGSTTMLWSPNSRYLFVIGKTGYNNFVRPLSFWMIDVAQDRIVADYDAFAGGVPIPAEWQSDSSKIVFEMSEDLVNVSTAQVTMSVDGSVQKDPISEAEYQAAIDRVFPSYNDPISPYQVPLSSPSGHYVNDKLGVLTDAVTKLSLDLPAHSDAVSPIPIDVRWHPAEEWALFGYQRCFSDCSTVGGVNVVNVVTNLHRELSQCGFGTTCVGWLPDNVDISRLPKGQAQSVLPTPIRYNYNVDYVSSVDFSKVDPLITCDPTTDKHFHILDPNTRETIFILRTKPDCTGTEKWQPVPFAFALSPNGKWYALADGIYDARSDELLAHFNTSGWELSFNADSSQLSMRSINARMVWDVSALLQSNQRMKRLAQYFQRH